jgi:serine/threonine-protein kinase
LAAAHDAGVVHRDLKPENIFILRQKAGLADFVKIIDFGISKFQPLTAGEGLQMTATGIVVGTPCYLSPEQARGSREADARSDLYAVGVILYECVTGQLPFDAQNVNDLLFKIVLESPRPLREAAPDVDPAFAQIIEIAMTREPERRFQSASAFIAALDNWAAEHGVLLSTRASGSTAPVGGAVSAQSADLKLASGATRPIAPTPGTWADSNVSVSAFQPSARRRRLLPLVAVGACVLVGGVAFAFLTDRSPEPSGAATSGAAATASAVPKTPASVVTETPAPAEPVAPPVADVEPPPPPNDAEMPSPVAQAPVRRIPFNRAPAPVKKAATPVPAKPPVEAPPPASSSSAKRRRDFGY